MDYLGSKEKLNRWIFERVAEYAEPGTIFLDACAGSGSTSRFAASLGLQVIACDILHFPMHLVQGSIGVDHLRSKAECHIKEMNGLQGVHGFLTEEYSEAGSGENKPRLYFTAENAMKLDACRQYIESVRDERMRSVLLYCLIEAMSRVSNTAGTFGAYLKQFKERAKASLVVRLEQTFQGKAVGFCGDVRKWVMSPDYTFKPRVIYIDPPYNNRQYAPNYHLYETLVLYDDPEIGGKTGLRKDWLTAAKSDFCNPAKFGLALTSIAHCSGADFLFLSYSSDGLMTAEQIAQELPSWPCILHKRKQRRYKADNGRTNRDDELYEYLFEIAVRPNDVLG